jgi:peroxiredoxin Q/BCP
MKAIVRISLAACLVGAAALTGASLRGDDVKLDVGSKAPAFEATDDNGKVWKSSDMVGKKIVVLYFYPADFTGGCTAQACGFRDNFKALTDKGVAVIGISGDSAKTHEQFKKAHKLDQTLLCDEAGEVAKKFGVPFTKGEKKASFEGNDFIRQNTIQRWTVVIDREGKIAALYNVKNAGKDSEQVLTTVEKLQKN